MRSFCHWFLAPAKYHQFSNQAQHSHSDWLLKRIDENCSTSTALIIFVAIWLHRETCTSKRLCWCNLTLLLRAWKDNFQFTMTKRCPNNPTQPNPTNPHLFWNSFMDDLSGTWKQLRHLHSGLEDLFLYKFFRQKSIIYKFITWFIWSRSNSFFGVG